MRFRYVALSALIKTYQPLETQFLLIFYVFSYVPKMVTLVTTEITLVAQQRVKQTRKHKDK